nr:hypothetical protein [Tanacetum cinerariifolium]
DAVEAVVDVARGAPQVAHGRAPFPGFVVAPLADAEYHRPPGLADSGRNGFVRAFGLEALRVAPVVLEIIDAPLGVHLGILKLVASATRPP